MPVQFLTQRFETVRYVTVAQGVLLLTIKHVLLIIYAGDINNSPIMPQWNQYIARRHHHKLDILSPIFTDSVVGIDIEGIYRFSVEISHSNGYWKYSNGRAKHATRDWEQ